MEILALFEVAILGVISGVENDTAMISFITGPLIGLLVGLITKLNASAGVKAVANLLLSAAAGTLVQFTTNTGSETISDYVIVCGMTWVTSLSTYLGFWKPTKVADAIQNATPNVGIGSPPDLEVDTPAVNRDIDGKPF